MVLLGKVQLCMQQMLVFLDYIVNNPTKTDVIYLNIQRVSFKPSLPTSYDMLHST